MEDNSVFSKVLNMIEAHYPILYLTTFEYSRTKQKLHGLLDLLKGEVCKYEWDCVNGLVMIDSQNKVAPINIDDEPIVEAEMVLKYALSKDKTKKDIFILNDFNEHIEEENIKFYIRTLSEKARYTNTYIVILSAIYKLPIELEKYVTVVNIPLPDRVDLAKTLTHVEKESGVLITPSLRNRLIDAALGMTTMEADLAFCLAVVKDHLKETSVRTVSEEKEQIIRKSGILDFFPKNESLKDVGGMDNLKDWLLKRQKAYDKKAREWGLQEPKGLLLLGVPGCGKSLTAKSIASCWEMPLLRLDIGRVFQGLVGSSEDNIRKALATAEAVAPCVLWIDEIEKGLSGVQSSGSTDGGVTSRIFSTILTWMQEKTSPVFVVATANDVNSLPPELLRKGRFDEIFFVDLPSSKERKNIFSIHLAKRNQKSESFAMEAIAKESEGFNGAEIEECVKEAMFDAYVANPENPQLTTKFIIDAIKRTVPLSVTMDKQISNLRDWAATRARNASSESRVKEKADMPILLTRPELEMERSFDLDKIEEK
jgi:SpoVK/Ycf46/Vps4 family AAA+-type ATPase